MILSGEGLEHNQYSGTLGFMILLSRVPSLAGDGQGQYLVSDLTLSLAPPERKDGGNKEGGRRDKETVQSGRDRNWGREHKKKSFQLKMKNTEFLSSQKVTSKNLETIIFVLNYCFGDPNFPSTGPRAATRQLSLW